MSLIACPIQATFTDIGGKWKMLVLWYLRKQTLRYGEIRRNIPEVSDRMLARSLRELETAGFVVRTAFPEVPPRVEYNLTDRGQSIVPIIDQLVMWAFQNARP